LGLAKTTRRWRKMLHHLKIYKKKKNIQNTANALKEIRRREQEGERNKKKKKKRKGKEKQTV
jgi:hypothetical protein